MRQLLTLGCALLTALIVTGCSNLQPVLAPSFQVAVSDQKKIHEAIREALVNRNWSITGQRANGFDAEYQRSADMRARIRVTHSGNHVSIAYVDSSNLAYTTERGEAEIHKRYNTWVTNLERDIQVEIGKRL